VPPDETMTIFLIGSELATSKRFTDSGRLFKMSLTGSSKLVLGTDA